MTLRQTLELVLLASLWGASFLFMRVGVPEFGPFAYMMLRVCIAALFLLPLMMSAQKRQVLARYKKEFFVVGLTNTAIPFALFGYAALSLTAGMSSILNATTPMLAALVAFFWLRQKLDKVSVVGLVIGFVGVIVLTLDKNQGSDGSSLLAMLAIIGATSCYGIAASYTKLHLQGVSSLAITTGSQLSAALMLLPFGFIFWPETMPSATAWSSVIVLGIVCTAFALILYFRLIAQVGPAKAVSVTYLIPVFGIFWGMIFLQESLSLTMVTGAALILFGVSLTTGVFKRLVPVQNKTGR